MSLHLYRRRKYRYTAFTTCVHSCDFLGTDSSTITRRLYQMSNFKQRFYITSINLKIEFNIRFAVHRVRSTSTFWVQQSAVGFSQCLLSRKNLVSKWLINPRNYTARLHFRGKHSERKDAWMYIRKSWYSKRSVHWCFNAWSMIDTIRNYGNRCTGVRKVIYHTAGPTELCVGGFFSILYHVQGVIKKNRV